MKKILLIASLCLVASNAHAMATKAPSLVQRWQTIVRNIDHTAYYIKTLKRVHKIYPNDAQFADKYAATLRQQISKNKLELSKLLNQEITLAKQAFKQNRLGLAIGGGVGSAVTYQMMKPLVPSFTYIDTQDISDAAQDLNSLALQAAELLNQEKQAEGLKGQDAVELNNVEEALEQTAQKLTAADIEAMPEVSQEELDRLGIS